MDACWKLAVAVLFAQVLWAFAATHKTKVLILGGGAAGIGFANRLYEKGQTNFIVVEAKSLIGGRIKNAKLGSTTIEEGANWIHGADSSNSLNLLKKKFGLVSAADNYADFVARDLKGNIVPDAKQLYTKIKTKIGELGKMNEKMSKNGEFDIPLKTAFELVGWKPKTPMEKTIDFYMNDFENESPPWTLSAQSVGFTGDDHDEVVKDPRGYAYLLRQLARNFSSNVHLDTVVKKISYDDKKVTVVTSNGTKYEADFAYVTFSTGVLVSSIVQFSPPLPHWKTKAANMLPMSHYTKIFLKFPTKFWDNNRYILVASEKRGHYVHYMNLDRPDLLPGQKILLATVTDLESIRVEKLTDAQVKSEVMAVLKQVYPNATTATDIFLSRWSLDNTTYGAYSSPVIGSDKYTYENLKAPVNKTLWFGGEAATNVDDFGYAHGAYSGGVAQANQLLSCLGNSASCPVYKPRPAPQKNICSSAVNIQFSCLLLGVTTLFSCLFRYLL